MTKFIFAYHGGSMPETDEERAQVMAAGQGWMQGMSEACVDMGAPVGMSQTVSSTGVADDGGSNPLSGYTIVEAADAGAACAMAKGCPILDAGGSVEVAPIMEM